MGKSKITNEILQEQYFDNFSKRFKDKNLLELDLPSKQEIQEFINFFSLPIGSHILEVGCGVGRYVIPLLEKGYRVTGVDISEQSLNILQVNAEKLNLSKNLIVSKYNFERSDFVECFDGAFAINLLHHLGDRVVQFSNIVKSVKTGGTIAILEPNPYNPLFYPYYLLTGSWRLEKGFLQSTAHKLKKVFEEESLKEIKTKRYGLLPSSLGRFCPFILGFNRLMCNTPIINKLAAFTLIRGLRT